MDGHAKHKVGQLEIGQVIRVDATDFDKIDFENLLATAEKFTI